MERARSIIRTSIAGIAVNIILAVFKFIVGTASNSVSIRMDAVNNVSDALSSLITIIGTMLSIKAPDRNHPFGYGRTEYLSALLIGMLIVYAGATSLFESAQRIVHPQPIEYSTATFIVMAGAIICKIVTGTYIQKRGKALDSEALIASGHDSVHDSILTLSALIAALIMIFSGINIEAYVGALISVFIIKSGIDTLRITVSDILGERISADLAQAVKQSILEFPEVEDVFDLAIHSYGKDTMVGSAHIEVADALKASWIDNLQRNIAEKVLKDTGVMMMGVSIYAVNSRDETVIEMRDKIRELAGWYEDIIQVNGFYVDQVDKAIKFAILVNFGKTDKTAVRDMLKRDVEKCYPGYEVYITIDYDFA